MVEIENKINQPVEILFKIEIWDRNMEFNNNMTGNNIEGQSYAFGQIHQEEYGRNNGSSYNQFCMTETQVKRIYFIISGGS